MPNGKLDGNISLVGFEQLDSTEQDSVTKIVTNSIKRMSETGNYKEMRLTLQTHERGKRFKHEVNGVAFFNEGRFAATVEDWSPYKAVSAVCDKILEELIHARKKEQRHEKLK